MTDNADSVVFIESLFISNFVQISTVFIHILSMCVFAAA